MEEFKRDKMFDWKGFERVYSVIKLLRETSSSNAKASILKQYKDTPHLQDLLYYTYNKDLKYKITLKAELDPVYEITNMLQLVIDHINSFSLDILNQIVLVVNFMR